MKRALDLFCGAGGATKGLQRAGFHVTGVDIKLQSRYCGDTFVQYDAMEFASNGHFIDEYDFIWASPPCQHYSAGRYWVRGHNGVTTHPDLIGPIRILLLSSGLPWVIENVEGAPLINAITLCGSMFGLRCAKGYLKRHRCFESNLSLSSPECKHEGMAVGVYGHGAGGMWGYRKANATEARELLGIDWMNRDQMREAIPPAYSEYIGKQIMEQLQW